MEWIKTFLSYSIKNLERNKEDLNKEFEKENNPVMLLRIQIVSIAVVILGIYYGYVDFISFRELKNTAYLTNLRNLHLIMFLGSITYLIFYEYYKRNKEIVKDIYLELVIKTYLVVTLIIGNLSSLNSQNLTGNIDSYIIVSILVAVAFPLKPLFIFLSFFINHALFIMGITFMADNKYELITKQLNSTFMIIMAYILAVISYKYRKEGYYNKSNLEKLFDINPYPLIIERFKDGKIIRLNKKLLDFYNISLSEEKDLNVKDLYFNKRERENIMNKLEEEGSIYNYILEHKTRGGLTKWVIANYEVINYRGEKCILCGMTDITELKKMETELIKNAATDILTGVYNRRTGMELLKKKTEDDIERNFDIVICFIDINKLKYVNDNYGHSEGDYYIATVCNIIKGEIDKEDILFRFGGDEFVIGFVDKSIDSVEKIWNRIDEKFNELNDSNNKPYNITVSHGIQEYKSNMDITLEEAIHLADEEMYKEKYCRI